jgi:hypothetical protein
VWLEGLGKLKKSTSSGIRTGDLPACSIVPQPTTLPSVPHWQTICYPNILDNFYVIIRKWHIYFNPTLWIFPRRYRDVPHYTDADAIQATWPSSWKFLRKFYNKSQTDSLLVIISSSFWFDMYLSTWENEIFYYSVHFVWEL